MKMQKLDEKIDATIIKVLPSPINRVYAAYNGWCNKHSTGIVITLLILSVVVIALAFINNHFYPNRK